MKSALACPSAGRVATALLPFLASPRALAHTAYAHVIDEYLLLPSEPGLSPRPEPGLSPRPEPLAPAEHTFTLRHIYHHGTRRQQELHRKRDVVQEAAPRVFLAADSGLPERDLPRLRVKSQPRAIERLVDRRPSVVEPLVAQSRRDGFAAVMDSSAWTVDDVPSPDITDKETVLSLAYMAADAYVEGEGQPQWEDVGDPFNRSADFGWHSGGLRGHIFADETNSTIVIDLKGTTPAVFDGDGTTTKDKVNDNLFFSCCCGQQGQWTWHQVCDCATGTYSCNNTCVVETLRQEDHYYAAARELYSNVTELYPHSTIWLTGHSLGGAVTSFLGLTYGLPVVTFEAVPEALAATRLGLPVPPGAEPGSPQTREHTGAFHFGHTADPVYTGTCNGATASCSFAGYAMETTCHTGHECVWDVVVDKGWRVGIDTHKIRAVIQDVILTYDDLPSCRLVPECRDCAMWKMYERNGTRTSTTSASPTSTRTRTRSSTCQTPGWWVCLDKTTGTPTSTPTSTGSSTSMCKETEWFWCKDKTTSTSKDVINTTTTTTTPSSTTTCKTPGWFRCKDRTPSTTYTTTATTTTTTTCETPGRFWGCWDVALRTTASAMPGTVASLTPPLMTVSATASATASGGATRQQARKFRQRNWLGSCIEWSGGDEVFSPDEM